MSQDKANNEAASAQQYCAWCAGEGTISTGIDEASSEQCRKCDGSGIVSAAEAAISPVPRGGGNTCDIFGCHFYGAARQCNDCTGSHLAHVARQRQESAAVAEGVDTPELRKLLLSIREAKHALAIGARTELLIAHIETVYGAQQREAGRLAGFREGVHKQAQEFERAKAATLARQPVGEGLTNAEIENYFKRMGWEVLPIDNFDELGEAVRALVAAAPPAKAEGMSDTDILNWLERKVVNVRDQLRYGSRDLFWSTPVEVEGELDDPSDLRAACRAAILAQQAKGEQP